MKNILLILMICITIRSWSQREGGSIILGLGLSHYIRDKQNELHIIEPHADIGPVAEIMYQFSLNRKLKYIAGLSYQYMIMPSYKEETHKFLISEISVLVLIRKALLPIGQKQLFITTGLCPGKLVGFKLFHEERDGWHKQDYHILEHYSNDNRLFADLYFDVGLISSDYQKGLASLSAFLRYRIKDYWLGYYKAPLYYGAKLNIRLYK